MQARRRTNNGERGSAMLIVLVLAAIIAIMLYKEMPVSAFEKQRQNEELLVARGDQYKRAVKLFVRKFGRFPSTIAELESTNRMRFLRQKYVDPLTGKDDWRLIHAGPGGIILDSKVNTTGKPGANALGQGATFGGFNNSIVQPTADADQPGISAAALRQRAPAVSSSGAGGIPAAGGGNSDFPPLPGTGESPAPGVGNGQGLYPGLAAPGADGANASQNAAQGPGQANGQTPAPLDAMGGMANNPNGIGSGIGSAGQGNSSVAQQLGTQNPATPQTAGAAASATSAFPQNPNAQQAGQGLAAGGIAGVAVPTTVAGKSIKTVNDQKKYSLWEFYYDLKKDQTGNAAGALQQGQNGAVGQNGLNNQNNGTNGFGAGSSFGSNGSSSFGNSSGFGSSQTGNGQSGSAPVNGQLPVSTPPQE